MTDPQFEPLRLLQDNAPVDRYCGLTTREIRSLLDNPVGADSPVTFQDDIQNSTLDAIPFFRLTEELLRIIQREGSIHLTKTGALPGKVLVELYEHKLLTEHLIESGFIKLRQERDSTFLWSLHANTELTGTARKVHGKLLLTKNGSRLLLPENRTEFFKLTFRTFVDKFNWAANDLYRTEQVGQLGAGFTLCLLEKFGSEERTLHFYADLYLKVLPELLHFAFLDQVELDDADQARCYWIRTFDRFLEWFGFVMVHGKTNFGNTPNDLVNRTEAFGAVFKMA